MAQAGGLFQGIFTRRGGVSPVPFDSLNVGYSVGDDRRHVDRNRARIQAAAGLERLFFLHQVHDCKVVVLGNDPAGYGRPEADAVVTDRPDIGLTIQTADCQAVLIFDPRRRVIANVHSGWRGSIQNVVGATIEAMKETFGCHPAHILAGIGPSLGPCCAEFVNYRKEIPEACWAYKSSDTHFDFWAMSRDQLMAAGVPAGGIESAGMCTRCAADRFFSYRAGRKTGRFAAVIALKAGQRADSAV